MPAFGTIQAGGIGAITPGDLCYFFNKESVSPPVTSVPLAYSSGPLGGVPTKTFNAKFATVPSAATVNVLAGNDASNVQNFSIVGTITFTGVAAELSFTYTDDGKSTFYAMQVQSATGGGNFTGSVQA